MNKLYKYIGQKTLDLSYIIKQQNIKTYIEPFGGSFNVGLNLGIKNHNIKLIYNDIDEIQYNIWRYTKENIFKFLDKADELIKKFNDFGELDEVLHYIDISNEFEQTVGHYLLFNSISFNGGSTFEDIDRNYYSPEFIMDFIDVAKRIELNNLSYEEIIDKYDSKDTFFFLDPPYYMNKTDSYYRANCKYFYHKEFAERVKQIKGKFLITYNISDYISELFNEYRQDLYTTNQYKKTLYIRNFDIDENIWCRIINTYNY